MKELPIQQKANRYDEAIKRAKELLEIGVKDTRDKRVVLSFFPELQESNDEGIRKEITDFIKRKLESPCSPTPSKKILTNWIAWLEKQGEQNPSWSEEQEELIKVCQEVYADILSAIGFDLATINSELKRLKEQFKSAIALLKKQGKSESESLEEKVDNTDKVEPKFKVSKWYQCTKDFFGKGVTFDKNTAYYCAKEGCLQDEYGCHIAIVKDLYDNFKLWTIEDANDGDVLCYKDEISLYKHDIKNCTKQEPNFGGFVYYCCYDGKRFIVDSLYSLIEQDKMDIHPATKEQHDNLFQKMKEAGYKWNADKKELIKL